MFFDLPLLSILIWLPVLGGVGVMALGGVKTQGYIWAKSLSLLLALLTLILCIPLYQGFDTSTAAMQFVEKAPWIDSFAINYYLGVDGIALPLVMLTCFICVIVVLAGWEVIQYRAALYMGGMLVMTGLMNGVFMALDAILFYVFWEAMLVPMFFIIGIWGGPNRVYATIKFFLYTFFGSVAMLVALLYLAHQANSFDILAFHRVTLGMTAQTWIFIAFFLAFAVKVPMWPVHTWLPDAHVEAPTGGSVVLAAIMLKMGAYGFLRFALPIAPDASQSLAWLVIGLSLIAVIYIGLVALAQDDMKKLIAYSSIAHMGFVTLGLFIVFALMSRSSLPGTAATLGMEGAIVQMISHGFISGAMFLCVGVLYDRMHSRRISDYGGVANSMPLFAAFFMLFAMANAGLPGTSGFVGEFMVILAAFQLDFWVALAAASTLILGAAYTLWMYKRVVFGTVANDKVAGLSDINLREGAILSVLAFAVLALGLWPDPLLNIMHASVDNLLQSGIQSKL